MQRRQTLRIASQAVRYDLRRVGLVNQQRTKKHLRKGKINTHWSLTTKFSCPLPTKFIGSVLVRVSLFSQPYFTNTRCRVLLLGNCLPKQTSLRVLPRYPFHIQTLNIQSRSRAKRYRHKLVHHSEPKQGIRACSAIESRYGGWKPPVTFNLPRQSTQPSHPLQNSASKSGFGVSTSNFVPFMKMVPALSVLQRPKWNLGRGASSMVPLA